MEKQETSEWSVMFYNVENLFDTEDDPLTADDEFTPDGVRRWNSFRFYSKLKYLSKVILSANGFDPPAIVGLCEVENRFVLEQLLEHSPLKQFNYQIIHKDSPDGRGIDVALLYRKDRVRPINYQYIPMRSTNGDTLASREILKVAFAVGGDSCTVFVNHWPSRYGGQAETEGKRALAASTLKAEIERIYDNSASHKIVIVGDFNDEPHNKSLAQILGAKEYSNVPGRAEELINLSTAWRPSGTLKHQQSWQVFDQLIVSAELLKPSGLHCFAEDAQIVNLPFLLEDDGKWGGQRPFRTYRGFKYAGGFSDHLPVLLRLQTTTIE